MQVIYDVIKSCYQTGLPPDIYRPRQPMLTHPVTTHFVVDAYLRDISRDCVDIEGNAVVIPMGIRTLCCKSFLERYNLKAPC